MDYIIPDIYTGDSVSVQLEYTDATGADIDLTGSTIYTTIQSLDAAYNTIVYAEDITVFTDGAHGRHIFTLAPEVTTTFSEGRYIYDFRRVDVSDSTETVEGTFRVFQPVTEIGRPEIIPAVMVAVARLSNDEKAALAGTSGTPSASNKFVTDNDSRLTHVTVTISSVTGLQTALDLKANTSDIPVLPTLATVATTGSYDDLTDKPSNSGGGGTWGSIEGALSDQTDLQSALDAKADTSSIPDAQVQTDWTATTGKAVILHKPSLATVATSGSYDDLADKPSIPSISGLATTVELQAVADTIPTVPTLATVATSGSYDDLVDVPPVLVAPIIVSGSGYAMDNGSSIYPPASGYSGRGTVGVGALSLEYSDTWAPFTQTGALGDYSFTCGFNNLALGDFSVALGRISQALGTGSIAIGEQATASAYSVGIGASANASGPMAVVIGCGQASGQGSAVVGGAGNISSGLGSVTLGGNGANASNYGEIATCPGPSIFMDANWQSYLVFPQRGSFQFSGVSIDNQTPVQLYLDGTTQTFDPPAGSFYSLKVTVLGVQRDGSTGDAVYQMRLKSQGTTVTASTQREILAWEGDANLGTPTITIGTDGSYLTVSVTPDPNTAGAFTIWSAVVDYLNINSQDGF